MFIKLNIILIATLYGCYFIIQYYSYSSTSFCNVNTPSNATANANGFIIHREFEVNGTIRYPWENDSQCSSFAVQFGKNLSLTYLASFPRSGNTWLRYLIEGATGLFTSSVFRNKMLYDMEFLGELEEVNSKRTIVTKIHGQEFKKKRPPSFEERTKFIPFEIPVILLIRNPFKSLISYWNYLGAFKSKKVSLFSNVGISTYKKKAFQAFVGRYHFEWEMLYSDRLIMSQNILVLFYEDIQDNLRKELLKILYFLELPVDEERLECLLKNSEGPAKRKHIKEYDPFTKLEKAKITYSIIRVLSLAEKRGFKPTSRAYKYIVDDFPTYNPN